MLTPAVLNIRSQLAITSSLLVPPSRVETFIVLYIGLRTYHASKAASFLTTSPLRLIKGTLSFLLLDNAVMREFRWLCLLYISWHWQEVIAEK